MPNGWDVVVAGPRWPGPGARPGRPGVALVERGPFPGAKNMYGGVVYGRVLDTLVPAGGSRSRSSAG